MELFKLINELRHWKLAAEYLARQIGKADAGGVCGFVGKPMRKCTGCGECVLYEAEQYAYSQISTKTDL